MKDTNTRHMRTDTQMGAQSHTNTVTDEHTETDTGTHTGKLPW